MAAGEVPTRGLMKRPAVFFDRDNTLIISDGYLGDSNKVVLVGGAADAVARVRGLGFATVVFSNQSGVARGMFGEDAVHAVNAIRRASEESCQSVEASAFTWKGFGSWFASRRSRTMTS